MRRLLIASALLLTACATRERVRVQLVNVPTPVPCPAAADQPTKPAKPVLPDDMEAALRVAVAHAARLSAAFDDVSGRLAACASSAPSK